MRPPSTLGRAMPSPSSLEFDRGGTRMLVLDDKNTILEYVLPDAFNLTGAHGRRRVR